MHLKSSAAGMLAFALLVGCSGGGPGGSGSISAEASSRVPSETVTDIVTYSDAVVVAEVVSERRGKTETEAEGGYTARYVTVHVQRSLLPKDRISLPRQFELGVLGWGGGEELRPMVVTGTPRMEVGKTYLVPVAPNPDGTVNLPSTDVVLEVRKGAVVVGGDDPRSYPSSVAGLTIDEVAQLLAKTPIDPAARPFLSLDPVARFNATFEAEDG